MKKKRILMVCEAFGGGVFTYVSQLCNDMVDEFDVYLAYSIDSQYQLTDKTQRVTTLCSHCLSSIESAALHHGW